jgi:hypothetical protein
MLDVLLELARLERTADGVPFRTYSVPDEWRLDDERQAQFWREAAKASEKLGFELEMAMARAILGALLVQNKYVDGQSSTFRSWPSRDRHQLWATAWLALRFVFGKSYENADVDKLILAHMSAGCATDALVFAVRSELLRRGFLVPASLDAPDGPLKLSREQASFLLDGDKLFVLRTAVAARRPWWALPLQAQSVAAPRPAMGSAAAALTARSFRCVLLEPLGSGGSIDGASGNASSQDGALVAQDGASPLPSALFVPVGGGAPLACTHVEGGVSEGGECFAALACTFDEPTSCMEVIAMDCDGLRWIAIDWHLWLYR